MAGRALAAALTPTPGIYMSSLPPLPAQALQPWQKPPWKPRLPSAVAHAKQTAASNSSGSHSQRDPQALLQATLVPAPPASRLQLERPRAKIVYAPRHDARRPGLGRPVQKLAPLREEVPVVPTGEAGWPGAWSFAAIQDKVAASWQAAGVAREQARRRAKEALLTAEAAVASSNTAHQAACDAKLQAMGIVDTWVAPEYSPEAGRESPFPDGSAEDGAMEGGGADSFDFGISHLSTIEEAPEAGTWRSTLVTPAPLSRQSTNESMRVPSWGMGGDCYSSSDDEQSRGASRSGMSSYPSSRRGRTPRPGPRRDATNPGAAAPPPAAAAPLRPPPPRGSERYL